MPQCPNQECKEEITELNAVGSTMESASLKNGVIDYQGLDYCEGHDHYECPECHEDLFKTEAEAVKFLKG